MKKILLLLFFIISTLSFSEWKVGYSFQTMTAMDYENKLDIWCDKTGIAFMGFILEKEELKKIEPTFSIKELNKLPFVDELEIFLQVDNNEKIMMKAYKMSLEDLKPPIEKIVLDITNGINPAQDDKESGKLRKIGKQMTEGKELKVTFIKGQNIVEKIYDLKGFKEKFEEAKKKNI